MMAEVNKQLSVKHRNPTTITEHVRSSVWFVEKMTMACRRAGRKVITGRVPRPKKSSEVDKLSCPSELATAEVEENDEKKGWKTSSKEKGGEQINTHGSNMPWSNDNLPVLARQDVS